MHTRELIGNGEFLFVVSFLQQHRQIYRQIGAKLTISFHIITHLFEQIIFEKIIVKK